MAGVALINGRNYAHQDILVNIGGLPVLSISGISFTKSQVKEFSYGTQPLPVGYGIGKKNAVELTFTISKGDADAIEAGAPNRDLLDLEPFDIPLTGTLVTNPRFKILKNVLITNVEETSDEDTTDIKVSITSVCSHIINIL